MPGPLQPGEHHEGDRSPHGEPSSGERPGLEPAVPAPEPDHTGGAHLGAHLDSPPPEIPGREGDDSEFVPLHQLDPRWVTAERISGLIGAAVVTVGGLVALLIFGAGWRVFGFSAWAVLAAAMFSGALLGPALQYRRARYRVTRFGIEIHWGILWRRVTIVPRSRIQHTDVEQGPLLRRFGLAKLVIHTAGTEHSTVPLYGLPMPRATAIRDDLMGRPATPPGAETSSRPATRSAPSGTGDGV